MNYQQFQEHLAEEVRNRSEGRVEVRLKTVTKNNGVARRTIILQDGKSALHPSVCMDPYYEEYRKGVPVSHLANLLLERCTSYGKPELPENFFRYYDEVRPAVFCKLVNREKNEEALSDIPHADWLDLSIVYYYQIDHSILPDASILIRNEHLAYWGIRERRLREDAWKNTVGKQEAVFCSLRSALAEMNVPAEDIAQEESPLYILTNRSKCFGAICICYPKKADEIAEKVGGSYYIIPSSIHECLILRAEEAYSPSSLNRMVREVNRTQLEPQEILSDHVYYFDALSHCIESETDRPVS